MILADSDQSSTPLTIIHSPTRSEMQIASKKDIATEMEAIRFFIGFILI